MVTYGTGQVAGTVAADTLRLGNITVDNQGFGLVLQASTDFLDISCDGLFVRPPATLLVGCQMQSMQLACDVPPHATIVASVIGKHAAPAVHHACSQPPLTLGGWRCMQGLGFPAISNLQTTPAFFNMLEDGQLDQPLFAMYLNPDISADPAGELSFGAVNPSLYVGKIAYTPVTQQKCAWRPLLLSSSLQHAAPWAPSHRACSPHVKGCCAAQVLDGRADRRQRERPGRDCGSHHCGHRQRHQRHPHGAGRL
jgi:hypothetical protein